MARAPQGLHLRQLFLGRGSRALRDMAKSRFFRILPQEKEQRSLPARGHEKLRPQAAHAAPIGPGFFRQAFGQPAGL
mgnify:CR=1 FL=1